MRLLKKPSIIILLLLCVSLSLSCGYTTSSMLPSNFKVIHIESFKNRINFASGSRRDIYLPLMEVDVQNAIVDRFQVDGNLEIGEEEDADLILSGELIRYHRGGLRYTDDDDVEEYKVWVTVAIKMFDVRTQTVLWSESGFAGDATYFETGSQATTEESAIVEAIEDLARRVVERTIEDW